MRYAFIIAAIALAIALAGSVTFGLAAIEGPSCCGEISKNAQCNCTDEDCSCDGDCAESKCCKIACCEGKDCTCECACCSGNCCQGEGTCCAKSGEACACECPCCVARECCHIKAVTCAPRA
jgi:hypothetical protein